ncbi:MAG: dihydrolipoamide acetyltransferase family protein, partial [Acidobacteria bacterium]|nr:dihydrolipoamide acetyltransferase family protein [Acidobacteriota bacterium]
DEVRIMASRVVMPKLSDTMEEGRIIRWLRKEGDPIETGQALAEVETDKATVEMEAYTNGTIRKLIASEGQFVKVGQLIGIIGGADEDISALVPAAGSVEPVAVKAAAPAPVTRPSAAPAAPKPAPAGAPAATGRGLKASPLALRMAVEGGLDLHAIQGTGPQGRIIKRDIEAAMTLSPAATAPARTPIPQRSRSLAMQAAREDAPEFEELELSSVRRTIAKRLVQSKGPVPHFYLTVDVAMDRVWDAYKALRDQKSTISVNDIIVKATALALRQHPDINASFAGDHIRVFSRVHIGMAVALEDGLITPVLRDVDLKPLEEISEEARSLADRARARKLQPSEYTGATFSISNLGMMGIEEFSAIINPPEAAILAVGAVRQVPVVVDGALAVGWRMKMTLSVDHRVADGASGARFLQTLKKFLEHPLLMA